MAQDFTNHTYQLITAQLSWHEAKADAESRGGHLATITSQAEFDYIASLGILPTQYSQGYWLGATDEAEEGVWRWVTGEPFDYNRWHGGEPNNSGPENYAIGDGGGYVQEWNDVRLEATPTIPTYLLEIEPPPCTPHKARATPQVVNGFVVGADITDPGCGYTNAPLVLIQGGGGNGAVATAIISEGHVTSIRILDAGCCYTNAPRIVIASPPFVPTVAISVSRVKVSQHVVLGRRYVLESSGDLATWTSTGPAFTAESETVDTEFDAEGTGKRFRIREVP